MEKEVPLDLIDVSQFDVRFYRSMSFFKTLCEDIKKEGVLVKPIVQELPNGRYRVLDGVTRVLALRKLGHKTVVTDVVPANPDERESLIQSLKINLRRASQDPVGVSDIFKRLIALGMKQKDLTKRFGYSKGHVSKLVSIANLSTAQKLDLAQGRMSIPQAYNLVKTRRNPDLMRELKIKQKCTVCYSSCDYGEIELVQLCGECRAKLAHLLECEKSARTHPMEQKELP
jgi:ParB-like chromosome segregation protein Spo0J